MPARGSDTAPQPTDRHWHLVGELDLDRDHAHAVAELLAREDAGRVPLAAAGAAYQRGRGDVIRAVRAELARDTSTDAGDVPFDMRLRSLLNDLAGSAGRVDRLDTFRAWIRSNPRRTDGAVLAALDAFEAAGR